MRFEIEIVKPTVQPAKTMGSGVAILGVVALRRCELPGAHVRRFGESSCESPSCLFDRFIDFEHEHIFIIRFANRGVKDAIMSRLNSRPRFPIRKISRGEHIYGISPLCASNIHCPTIHKRASELMSIC